MNDEHVVVKVHNHQFEEVAGPVWPGQQVAQRIVVQFDPRDRVRVGMKDVVIGDLMPARRSVDLRTK